MNSAADWTPYCGPAPLPGDWLARWNFDPFLLLALLLGFVLWRRWASGPGPTDRQRFGLAALLLVLLFVSPLCALSSALFSARVAHHVLLTAAVAPLIVASIPRRRLAIPGSLTFWTAAQALIFWAWHSPSLYAEALSSNLIYWTMQASLLVSAIGFWAAVRRANAAAAVAALLVTMVQMGLLGALITFAGAPLYAPHFSTTGPWGLAPLEDQQLAGLVMWVPSAGVYLAAAMALANRWLRSESRVAA